MRGERGRERTGLSVQEEPPHGHQQRGVERTLRRLHRLLRLLRRQLPCTWGSRRGNYRASGKRKPAAAVEWEVGETAKRIPGGLLSSGLLPGCSQPECPGVWVGAASEASRTRRLARVHNLVHELPGAHFRVALDTQDISTQSPQLRGGGWEGGRKRADRARVSVGWLQNVYGPRGIITHCDHTGGLGGRRKGCAVGACAGGSGGGAG